MLTLTPLTVCAWLWLAWAVYWFVAARFVQATRSSEGVLARMQHLLPLLVGFFLIFHGLPRPILYGKLYHSRAVGYVASALTAGGLLFAVWGRVHLGRYWSGIITLKEGHRLVRSGPYRLVRHPLYTGFLAAVLATAVAAATVDAFVGFAIILAAYVVKIRREEGVLTREFGQEYVRFKAEVPALVPGLRGFGKPASGGSVAPPAVAERAH